MHTIATGYVLVLVAKHVAGVAIGIIVASPVQVGEYQRGIDTELISIGLLWVARVTVTQCPIVRAVTLYGKCLTLAKQVLDAGFKCEVWAQTVVRTVSYTGIGSEPVDAGYTVSAEQFTTMPFFRGTHRKTGLIQFALENIIEVALCIQSQRYIAVLGEFVIGSVHKNPFGIVDFGIIGKS